MIADELALRPGDHLRVRRFGGVYTHHGVYMGDGRVIHFDGEPLQARPATIRTTTIDGFLRGGRLEVVRRKRALPTAEVVERAESALTDGFGAYRLLFRNCEHFATWCTHGRRRSGQVRRGMTMGLALIGTAASGAVWLVKRKRGLQGA